MKFRAAIRISEFRGADKLPKNITSDCAECVEKEEQDRRNCGGEGNKEYKVNIGDMEFYQCPFSIPDQDTWDSIELILTCEETGIPINGRCLLDQTRKYFELRRIINSERSDCMKEIQEIHKRESKHKEQRESSGNVPSTRSRIKGNKKK